MALTADTGESGALRMALHLFLTALVVSFAADGFGASAKPTTVAEIALYQGPDRGQILVDGAKNEGQVIFYNSNTWVSTAAREFEKKYPFIKVSVWLSHGADVVKRLTEEYSSGRSLADVVEAGTGKDILHRNGILQEYFTPESAAYGDEAKIKGKTGVYYLADREIYISLGFNTKLIPPAAAPKSYKDLLDPKWKGRMSIAGSGTGTQWVGNALEVMGREYMEKLGGQDIKVQNISAAALVGLIASGEVPLSPAIFDSNIFTARQKGAPVEWRPLEPVVVNASGSGMMTKAPHPHAALLFLDYLHSREGQQGLMKGGLSSPREDIGSLETKFKKSYLERKYSLEEFQRKMTEWENLTRRLFIRKR